MTVAVRFTAASASGSFITLAAVALYALYWTVRRAIRDELASLGGRDDPPSVGPGT